MGKVKKIKYDDIDKEISLKIKQNENEYDLIIINRIDGKYDYIPKTINSTGFSGIGAISIPLLFLSLSLGKQTEIRKIEVKTFPGKFSTQEEEEETSSRTYLTLYVIDEPQNLEYKKKEYSEKIRLFRSIEQNDPLNTKRLELVAEKMDLTIEANDLKSYENKYDDEKKNLPNASSKYVEVLKVIQELDELKHKKEITLYTNKTLVAYDLFEIYYNERFAFGVIIVGVYIFSVLANLNNDTLARKVFFKTQMYVEKHYDDFTNQVVETYAEILAIKASSIFGLKEYLIVTENLEMKNEKTKIVYRINLAAKYIENNLFTEAHEQLSKINKISPKYKNSGGVSYTHIYENNNLICSLINTRKSLEETILKFKAFKEEHIIFAINSNLITKLSNRQNMQFVDLNTLEYNTDGSFYKVYIEIHNAFLYGEHLSEDVEEQVCEIFGDNAEFIRKIIKKIGTSECDTPVKLEFEDVKFLLIDFNIWDYLDF